MKNLFPKKSNNIALIAAVATGVVIAGTATWYYFKRKALARKARVEQAIQYMKPSPQLHKKKTDIHDLHAISSNN